MVLIPNLSLAPAQLNYRSIVVYCVDQAYVFIPAASDLQSIKYDAGRCQQTTQSLSNIGELTKCVNASLDASKREPDFAGCHR